MAIENPFGISPRARGYQLERPLVQFDTVRGSGPAVISHAHSDHAAEDRSKPVYATPATAELLRHRGHVGRILVLEYDRWEQFDGWRLKLLPAGHILGSAQVLVERADGLRLLYTGDMKTRAGRTCEPARSEPADDLVIESTFGLPIFRFPPEPEVAAGMVAFARTCLENDRIPVFLGYALGKGQEIMSILAEGGIPMLVHASTWQIAEIYRRHGFEFGDAIRHSREAHRERRAWVIPPHVRHQMTRGISKARICYASGWALIESRRESQRASLLAPLSDHADYYDLLEVVEIVRPTRLWSVHGPYAELFARDVARRFGIQALSLDSVVVGEEEVQ